MVRYELLENFPLQVFSYADLQEILNEAEADLPQEWPTKAATREWQNLVKDVRQALSEVFVYGPGVKKEWRDKVQERLDEIAGNPDSSETPGNRPPATAEQPRGKRKRRRRVSIEVAREMRIAYLNLLDRIYGAILRHVLRHMPTSVVAGTGYFYLSWLDMFRYTHVHATEAKSALEQLLDIMHEGLRVGLGYSWKPLGEGLEEPDSRLVWRRR
jgi:hypothetical protein